MHVVMINAVTLNGKIGRSNDEPSTSWTTKEDRKFFSTESKKHGVVIMGRTTYATIGRPLPERLNIVLTREPDRYESIPGVLEFTASTPKQILRDLEQRGFPSAVVAGGSSVYAQFMNEGLIDEIFLTIQPKIFPGTIDLFTGLTKEVTLKLQEVRPFGDQTIFAHYIVDRSPETNL